MAVFRRRDREKRQEWQAYHELAMERARGVYKLYEGQEFVTRSGETEYGFWVTAASPSREAWDEYFTAMEEFGQDPEANKSYDRFKKELGDPSTYNERKYKL